VALRQTLQPTPISAQPKQRRCPVTQVTAPVGFGNTAKFAFLYVKIPNFRDECSLRLWVKAHNVRHILLLMLSREREPRRHFWPDLTERRSPFCNVAAQLFSADARAPLQRETKKPSACHPALRWAASGAGRSPPGQ